MSTSIVTEELWDVILGRLTDEESQAISLVFREGHSGKNAAKIIGVDPRRFSERLSSALNKLNNPNVRKYLLAMIEEVGPVDPLTQRLRSLRYRVSPKTPNLSYEEKTAGGESVLELPLADMVFANTGRRELAEKREDADLLDAANTIDVLLRDMDAIYGERRKMLADLNADESDCDSDREEEDDDD
jgi:predicted DNA-binding protein (UPF0251 family)